MLKVVAKLKLVKSHKFKIRCKDTGEKFDLSKDGEYARYLQSEHWNNVKAVAFLLCKRKCVCCGKLVGISGWVGHHRSTNAYKRIGRERKGDVVVVCAKCHNGRSKAHRDLHKNIEVPDYAKIKR